jgi:hypothetical protein
MFFCSSCDSVPLKCDRAEYLGKYLSIRQKGEGLSLAVKDQTFWQTISYRVCPRLRYTLVNYRRKLPANLAQISTTGGKSTSYTVHTFSWPSLSFVAESSPCGSNHPDTHLYIRYNIHIIGDDPSQLFGSCPVTLRGNSAMTGKRFRELLKTGSDSGEWGVVLAKSSRTT